MWIELIDVFDGYLDVSRVYGFSYLDSVVDRLYMAYGCQVRLCSKLLSSKWITMCDEVVHDQPIEVPMQDKRVSKDERR